MDDVVVVGAGPAGWAAAAACARAGLATTLVAPDTGAAWPATYAAWRHEVEGLGLPASVWRAVWAEVGVVGRRRHELPAAYGVFDNTVLAALLRGRGEEFGLRRVEGSVTRAEHRHDGSVVHLVGGGELPARLVVDASGAGGTLLHRGRPGGAAQVAHGVVVADADLPAELGDCLLMDWRPPVARARPGGPSFLYALRFPDGTWLLEETSLAARPPAPAALLEERLHRRLAGIGARTGRILGVERVHIPMGGPPPWPQRVVGFGAAGGLVHPATGYSVAASLRGAAPLAGAVAEALARRATPGAVAAAAWAAVWPPARRRARALEDYGLGSLLRLDQEGAQDFFDAFFAGPGWPAYLAGTAGTGEVTSVMRAVFRAAPGHVRARLARGDARPLGRLFRAP